MLRYKYIFHKVASREAVAASREAILAGTKDYLPKGPQRRPPPHRPGEETMEW